MRSEIPDPTFLRVLKNFLDSLCFVCGRFKNEHLGESHDREEAEIDLYVLNKCAYQAKPQTQMWRLEFVVLLDTHIYLNLSIKSV